MATGNVGNGAAGTGPVPERMHQHPQFLLIEPDAVGIRKDITDHHIQHRPACPRYAFNMRPHQGINVADQPICRLAVINSSFACRYW